jgi:hypothetical protein
MYPWELCPMRLRSSSMRGTTSAPWGHAFAASHSVVARRKALAQIPHIRVSPTESSQCTVRVAPRECTR